ncbi:hypothetical protein AAFF_G00050730 [Aldrovandia affinis]|uniref:Uncharacterized protein n=1 Tax=Aldrovandia affinis TaxID=143900 RepID=A0AAD7T4J5_9TELE|nr:hypothetical protein AAFF_G00050730 [Aldrovandia affinis]
MERLNTCVAKLLTAAVQEILEVVGETMSEYQEETARTERENESLRWKLLEFGVEVKTVNTGAVEFTFLTDNGGIFHGGQWDRGLFKSYIMSKIERLNARVAKLLTVAVHEVLEVVRETVSEYQEKTARTQRENESLRRRLQELQDKVKRVSTAPLPVSGGKSLIEQQHYTDTEDEISPVRNAEKLCKTKSVREVETHFGIVFHIEMSKIERLNARVAKLLTVAVHEVLEVVRETVSEYQEKTARTQRENESLRRRLQELQDKVKRVSTAGAQPAALPVSGGKSLMDQQEWSFSRGQDTEFTLAEEKQELTEEPIIRQGEEEGSGLESDHMADSEIDCDILIAAIWLHQRRGVTRRKNKIIKNEELCRMSKIERLNARVAKLLTVAVREVLEVVRETVSEYQEKTARTQRENESLRRRLQELQDKVKRVSTGYEQSAAPHISGERASIEQERKKELCRMSKIERLNARVGKLLTVAVHEVLEVVRETVSEYQEKTARTQRENESLRRRLQELQDKVKRVSTAGAHPAALPVSGGKSLIEQQHCLGNVSRTHNDISTGHIKDYKRLAIGSIICGISCIGICALINSVKVRERRVSDPEKAQMYSNKARKLSLIAIAVWVGLLILIPVLMALVSYLLTLKD